MKLIVSHLVSPYLFHTGTWIYSQINNLEKYSELKNIVFTQQVINNNKFPTDNIVSIEKFPVLMRIFNRIYRKVTDKHDLFFNEFQLRGGGMPNILHAHMGFEGYKWLDSSQKHKIPIITSFYGMDATKMALQKKWKKRYDYLFEKGDLFLVEGNKMKEQLVNIGAPIEKIVVQHLGIDFSWYPQKRTYEIGNKIYICQASTFREKKGIEYSLNAFKLVLDKHPNSVFVLIGDSDNEIEKSKIINLITKLNINDKVILKGNLSHSEMVKTISECDIFIHPSQTASDGDTEGGSPVVLTEASALGIPIISTLHADIPEVVVNSRTGLLFAEKQFIDLANGINRLIENYDIRFELGNNARVHIEREYNNEVQIPKLTNIYYNLAQN